MRWPASIAAAALLAACTPAPEATGPVGPTEPPRAVRTPPPTYPDALGCQGIGGRVDLRLTIGTDGRISRVALQRSSGQPILDKAAMDAVRAWEFRAGTRGGVPVSTTIQVPMTFTPPAERPDRCFALDEQR